MMNLQTAENERDCSREQIIAYLDGELAPREELTLEKHLAGCENCRAELNAQKRLFSALDSAFDARAEIELPKDFARVVATRAETSVKGLRSKNERFRALFFCALLFLTVVAGLGAETASVFDSFGKFGEQSLAVLNFTGHLAYHFIFGLTVVLRVLANQPVFNSAIVLALLFGAIAFSAVRLSSRIYHSKRF